MKIARFLNLLIFVLLLAITGAISISYNQSKQTKATALWVEHTQQVMLLNRKIQYTVIENETSTRGYVIMGRSDFKRISDSTGKKLIADIHALRSLTTDNSFNKSLLDTLERYAALRVAFSDTTQQVYRQDGMLAALALISTGRGLYYSRLTNACIEAIQRQEENLLVSRKRAAGESFEMQQRYLLMGMMVMLVLAGAFALKLKKEYAENRKYRTEILSLNRELEQKVQLRTLEREISKKQLEDIFFRITDAFIALDRDWRYTYINDNAEKLIGMKREAVMGKVVWELFPDAVGSKTWQAFHEAMEKQVPQINEDHYPPLNLWQENRIYPSADGVSVVISDISERKKLEARLQVAQRMYFFISQVNQVLVRVQDDAELMQEVCNIAVDMGGFVMAWVGMIDETTGQILKVVHAGNDAGYLQTMRITANEHEAEGCGPVGRAIRTGQYALVNDIENDEVFRPWREHALERGYRACAAFPLKQDGKVTGTFCVYAAEKHFFNEKEISLLEEASGDISFGLERFEMERRRKAAEISAQRESELARSLINSMPGTVALYSVNHQMLRWNLNLEKVTGYDAGSIRNLPAIHLIDPDEEHRVVEFINRVFRDGSSVIQTRIMTRDGRKIPYYFNGTRIEYEGETCILGIGIDLSDLVQTQQELIETTEQLHLLSRHLLEVREQERKRIGREIHDELGQQLTAIKMDISWIDRKIPASDPLHQKMLNVLNLLNTSNLSVRRILNELRPSLLDDHGLEEALQSLNRQFSKQTGVKVKFVLSGPPSRLSEPVSTCLYRVYQEALTNITRYAGATRVLIRLEIEQNSVVFDVEDDGKGFEPKAISRKKSFGILGMRERVAAVNGFFTIRSQPGVGTQIHIRIPFLA